MSPQPSHAQTSLPVGERIYLDNAATSWPKPEPVYQAVERAMRQLGAAAGRSAYGAADDARQVVQSARRAVARLLNAGSPQQIVFCHNGTDTLNLALHGFLRSNPGHVVTTVTEHNSVLRPLRHLQDAGVVQVSRVACDAEGRIDPADVQRAIRADTRLIALCHASNVTGAIQPAAEITALAHEQGVPVLLDAAQSLGEISIDVRALGVDLLAAPGHKGLLGPLGTGLLYIRPGLESQIESIRQGGTGSQSDDDHQPAAMPEKYEAGNSNVPALAGLAAGVEWLLSEGIAARRERQVELSRRFDERLAAIAGIRCYGPVDAARRVSLRSISSSRFDPQELAAALDSAYGVQVRAGLHCAPRMHEALGTLTTGGTVRFSPGPLTTEAEIDRAAEALAELHVG